MAMKSYYLPARGENVGYTLANKGSESVKIQRSQASIKGIASVMILLSVLSMAGLSEAKSISSNKLFSKLGTEAHTNSVRAYWSHNNLREDTTSIKLR
jgi:hypothetical protein